MTKTFMETHEKQFTKPGNAYDVNTYIILPRRV
jgi:hypothetical protein